MLTCESLATYVALLSMLGHESTTLYLYVQEDLVLQSRSYFEFPTIV